MQTILLYIDPDSGSYILQMIIAAVLGISFFFKNFWLAIKTFLFGKRPGKDEEKDKAE